MSDSTSRPTGVTRTAAVTSTDSPVVLLKATRCTGTGPPASRGIAAAAAAATGQ